MSEDVTKAEGAAAAVSEDRLRQAEAYVEAEDGVVNRLIGDGLARRHGAGFLVPSLPDLVARAGASLRGDVVMPIGVEAEADGRLRA